MEIYTGSCHCGAVTYSINADIEKVMECNCSHCSRKGFLLAFISKAQFTLHTGDANLTTYLFNKNHIHHEFCKTCGVQCFGHAEGEDGSEMYAINARTLTNIDLLLIPIEKIDGKSF